MATSSITANFYTDDPKAANAIVHALFTNVKPSPLPRGKVKIVRFKSDAEKRLFMEKAVRRARECPAMNVFCETKKAIGGKLVMVERESDRPKLLEFYNDNGFKSWTTRRNAKDGMVYDQMFAVLDGK